jgi:hypothetical protein
MSSTIDPRMVMRPELCDIVRTDWATDTLPDDGVCSLILAQYTVHNALPCAPNPCCVLERQHVNEVYIRCLNGPCR